MCDLFYVACLFLRQAVLWVICNARSPAKSPTCHAWKANQYNLNIIKCRCRSNSVHNFHWYRYSYCVKHVHWNIKVCITIFVISTQVLLELYAPPFKFQVSSSRSRVVKGSGERGWNTGPKGVGGIRDWRKLRNTFFFRRYSVHLKRNQTPWRWSQHVPPEHFTKFINRHSTINRKHITGATLPVKARNNYIQNLLRSSLSIRTSFS